MRTGARLRPLCPCSKAPDGLPGGACGRFSAGRLLASACGVGMCGGAGGRCRKADGKERVRVAAF